MSKVWTQAAAIQGFLSRPLFAVAGASRNEEKFGWHVLKWYTDRKLPVQPINPREYKILGLRVIKSIEELPSPTETSISVVTPPAATLGILKQAKALSIPSIWLQPGAEDEEVLKFIRDNDMLEKVTYGGPCILRLGDAARFVVQRELCGDHQCTMPSCKFAGSGSE